MDLSRYFGWQQEFMGEPIIFLMGPFAWNREYRWLLFRYQKDGEWHYRKLLGFRISAKH